jgi:hypothetical protein
MMRLERHYAALGVDVLFRHHPKLEEYLKEEFDETFISSVRYLFHMPGIVPLTPHPPRSRPLQQINGRFTRPISTRISFSTFGHQRKRALSALISQPTCPGRNGDWRTMSLPGS